MSCASDSAGIPDIDDGLPPEPDHPGDAHGVYGARPTDHAPGQACGHQQHGCEGDPWPVWTSHHDGDNDPDREQDQEKGAAHHGPPQRAAKEQADQSKYGGEDQHLTTVP